MQFIEIKNESGGIIEVPVHQVSFILRLPMEPVYSLALRGAVMRVDPTTSPFNRVKQALLDSNIRFEVFPIPEGTDVILNPDSFLFMTSIDLSKTAIMYPGGVKVIVAEGINTVRAKLTGKSIIEGA